MAALTCYRPIGAYWGPDGQVVFDSKSGYVDRPLELPCGQCIGCRQSYATSWAVRCVHEAQLHESSLFVTMTYDEDHLPADHGLHHDHVREFVRRLRRRAAPGLRYFVAGEYGDDLGRPHYHALLFGLGRPDDAERVHRRAGAEPLFRSAKLDDAWGMGMAPFGQVTMRSAMYCAQYALKKIRAKDSPNAYEGRRPPYCTMSRRPGIGARWIERFGSDVYPGDQVVIDGVTYPPPRFYDLRLPEPEQKVLRDRRAARAWRRRKDRTPERLRVREQCAEVRSEVIGRQQEVT